MHVRTKKALAEELLRRIPAMQRSGEFRKLMLDELGPELTLFLNEYAKRVAKTRAPGFAGDAVTLLLIGYLVRANEDAWVFGGKPRPSA